MISGKRKDGGFTLVELAAVIVIIGILAGIATVQFSSRLEQTRHEATLAEMNGLTQAICGRSDTSAEGQRLDFGYIGDVGALPPDLDALVTNPGYATWNGPYIQTGFAGNDFKRDAWGTEYTFQDTLLRSTGSGVNIDKIIAPSTAALVSNDVHGFLRDADQSLPGSVYRDSFLVILTYPDGSGGMASPTAPMEASGNFDFTGAPVGHSTLTIIYLPDTDTLTLPVNIYPGREVNLDIIFPADLW